MAQRSGGRILIDQIAAHGVRHIFTVPGESFLPALDAMIDAPALTPVVTRHEGAAAMMAEATGKLTGCPGVAFVTRSPGAANALSGVAIAAEDETPMLLLVGMPPTSSEQRHPFQSIDLTAVFGSLAKRVECVREPGAIPEAVARAMAAARSGKPGPVVLGFPEDVLGAGSDAADVDPSPVPRALPAPGDIAQLAMRIEHAERPLVIVGGPGWSADAQGAMAAFASRFEVPVAASFRCQDYIANAHPCFAGHLGIAIDGKLAAAVRSADLLIAIGAPLGEIATGGWQVLTPEAAHRVLVHVRPEADSFSPVLRAAQPVVADPSAFALALAALPGPAKPPPWSAWRRDLRRAFETWRTVADEAAAASPRFADLSTCIRTASSLLPANAIVTNGAGNYTAFLHRHFEYKGFRTALAPESGAMGYGLPAAIAAKLAYPDRPVVAFAGDGCFAMTAMELATAVQYTLPIVVVVVDNGSYGTIRMHQERRFPGRVVATSLINPDFASLARSFGAHAEDVRDTGAFGPALKRAVASGRPALVTLKTDPGRLSPGPVRHARSLPENDSEQ